MFAFLHDVSGTVIGQIIEYDLKTKECTMKFDNDVIIAHIPFDRVTPTCISKLPWKSE